MNAPTGTPLFATPYAAASAAEHMDVLRKLAEPPARPPLMRDAAAEQLGLTVAGLDEVIEELKRDGLVAWDDVTESLRLTRAGAMAALGVGVATGEVEFDLSAFVLTADQIVPNPDNPRGAIADDDPEVADLLETIIDKGILLPLLVYPPDEAGLHMLSAGERRWRAVRLGQRTGRLPDDYRIPCRRYEPSEAEAAAQAASVALVENGQRKNLSSYEEARAILAVVEGRPGVPIAQLARAHGSRDPRTWQEKVKVLREAKPEAIAAWAREELTWEEIRDSVKSVKLTPAQALIVLEVAARMDSEDPAAEEDDGTPAWIEVAHTPASGPHMDLLARGLLQFQAVEGVPLCRLRTDNPRLEGWLDAAFGCEPGERRRIATTARDQALWDARARALGAFTARELADSDQWATPWLNVAWPTSADLAEDLDGPSGTAGVPPAPQPEGLQQDHGKHENHETAHPADVRAFRGSEDSAPAAPEEIKHEGHEAREAHEGCAQTPADPPSDLRALRAPESAPAAQDAVAAEPTSRQRMILAEILHRTWTSPTKVLINGATHYGAQVRAGDGQMHEIAELIHHGWVVLVGLTFEVEAAVVGETGLAILGFSPNDAIAPHEIDRTLTEARKAAGLTLGQLHEQAQTRRYAWAPLNTDPPRSAAPPEPAPAPKPASAARAYAGDPAQLLRHLAADAQWAAEELAAALARNPLMPVERTTEAVARITEIQARAARARDFLASIEKEQG